MRTSQEPILILEPSFYSFKSYLKSASSGCNCSLTTVLLLNVGGCYCSSLPNWQELPVAQYIRATTYSNTCKPWRSTSPFVLLSTLNATPNLSTRVQKFLLNDPILNNNFFNLHRPQTDNTGHVFFARFNLYSCTAHALYIPSRARAVHVLRMHKLSFVCDHS